jgi:hypothetical protein
MRGGAGLSLGMAATIACAQPVRENDPIVLRGLVAPERETLRLEASCFSRRFLFQLDNNRAGPSALTSASVEGRPARSESLAVVRDFLRTVRNARFGSAACVSPDQIDIGVTALLLAPRPGQRDDVLRIFRVSFEP